MTVLTEADLAEVLQELQRTERWVRRAERSIRRVEEDWWYLADLLVEKLRPLTTDMKEQAIEEIAERANADSQSSYSRRQFQDLWALAHTNPPGERPVGSAGICWENRSDKRALCLERSEHKGGHRFTAIANLRCGLSRFVEHQDPTLARVISRGTDVNSK